MFALFGLFKYCDHGSSTFFSYTLTVNVIDLLFLQQCLRRLLPSTETWISGTSPQQPIWRLVSQYVYSRITWRDVNSCYCDWRVQSGFGLRFPYEIYLWNFLMRFPHEISLWDFLMRFPHEISLWGLRLPHEISCLLWGFKIVAGKELVPRRWYKGSMRGWAREKERERGGGGGVFSWLCMNLNFLFFASVDCE